MIKLKDAYLHQIMPQKDKYNVLEQCHSYAMHRAMEQLIQCADGARPGAAIDELPEAVLDYLALQLNAQFYDQTMDVETKRNIIKNARQLHRYDGTRWAVEKTLEVVYGSGKVEEWNEYGGKPGRFKVEIDTPLDLPHLKKVANVIRNVKRSQAIMDGFDRINSINQQMYFGTGTLITKHVKIKGREKNA